MLDIFWSPTVRPEATLEVSRSNALEKAKQDENDDDTITGSFWTMGLPTILEANNTDKPGM